MKKILLVLFIITAGLLSAAELSPSAVAIKESSPDGYAVIRAAAIEKWGTDHQMVLYEINTQSDSCIDVLSLVFSDTGDYGIFLDALEYWSFPGKADYNLSLLQSDDPSAIFKLECDWQMVEYQYNKQMESASKY